MGNLAILMPGFQYIIAKFLQRVRLRVVACLKSADNFVPHNTLSI